MNSEKYCSQLDELKTTIDQKTSRTSKSEERRVSSGQCAATCIFDYSTKVVEAWLGCAFHLFRLLQNSLNGKNFNSLVEIKNHVEKFFAEKPERFWKDGIFKLYDIWRKVVKTPL